MALADFSLVGGYPHGAAHRFVKKMIGEKHE
jgi:hypothetical protein